MGYVFLLAACGPGSAAQAVTVTNNDPLAPPELQQLSITPPEGWRVTADGSGITDEQFVVTVTTLSSSPADPQTALDGVDGREHETRGRRIIVDYQLDTRLVAWFILDNATVTTVKMQSRTPVTFANDHETVLVEIAESIRLSPTQ
jgi:hypothetical protein